MTTATERQQSLQVKNFTEHLEEKISEQHVLQERALPASGKKVTRLDCGICSLEHSFLTEILNFVRVV